ncbi:MAG TPA: hypothetical protein VHC97_07375 [Thermoanaerobaculia bacterium]|jgi:hypothetical protein|nr:hypothetical protein [Thermoanaerobaculia bacterium]
MKARLAFLLLTLVLTVAAIVSVPKTASALCRCVGSLSTQSYSGMGASCSEAEADLRAQANNEAQTVCFPDSVCSSVLVIDTACYWDPAGQVYRTSGHMTYKCFHCF